MRRVYRMVIPALAYVDVIAESEQEANENVQLVHTEWAGDPDPILTRLDKYGGEDLTIWPDEEPLTEYVVANVSDYSLDDPVG